MYIIIRTDKEYGGPSIIHKTLDEAEGEANRLATKHVHENPYFTIYELKGIKTVFSTVLIQRK